MLPVTATMPMMTTIGKGPMVLLTGTDDPQRFSARLTGFVAIYSAIGLRDDAINTALAQALAKNPFALIKMFRRDAHERADNCWIHTHQFCLQS